ncbi:MAG: sulfide/dihydroorotate dehydrogenase-like FAD/NAD-binding protein [Spirochaetales bacterium]|nr:sulfide/dihydroorotate dehydrogenase-like FAD/NAD-binding protein [Spirochaetales bacterium]
MHSIIEKEIFSDVTKLIVVEAKDIAQKAKAGQFVIIRISEKGERIPLTLADFDPERGTITLVYQEVGKSTMELGTFNKGDSILSITGPLGCATEIENFGKVICIGGGVGIAPMYPIARELKKAGNHVISILGARNKDLLFWEEKMRAISDEVIICTDDGSHGQKGVVTVPLKKMLDNYGKDIKKVWAIGPAIMMKFCAATTEEYSVPTIVSLNSIMVDGTGMCGACRVKIGDQTQFVCVDGPEFDAHAVDWNLVLARQKIYLKEEKYATELYTKRKCCSSSLDSNRSST